MSKGSKRRPGHIPKGEWERIFGEGELTPREQRDYDAARVAYFRERREKEPLDFNDPEQNRDRFNRHYFGDE